MVIQQAELKDLDGIMVVINQSKQRMKAASIDQWQGAYPGSQDIQKDIELNQGYVLFDENEIVGYMAIEFEVNAREQFSTVHRVALRDDYVNKGYSSLLQKEFEQIALANGFNSIRIDTHPANQPMRAFIKKSGYFPIGTLLVADGLRLAYEKRLDIIVER